MKTAISIDDEVFFAAEQSARQLGVSRSKLYSLAVSEYIKTHTPAEITKKLNKVYGENDSSLDEDLRQANYDLLPGEEW